MKVLLSIDNAPGHLGYLKVSYPNIEVIFLPLNNPSLIQPLNQGVISTFKTYYTHRTFCRILDVMDSNPELTVRQCWKELNIAHCISTIKEMLDEVRASTINAC